MPNQRSPSPARSSGSNISRRRHQRDDEGASSPIVIPSEFWDYILEKEYRNKVVLIFEIEHSAVNARLWLEQYNRNAYPKLSFYVELANSMFVAQLEFDNPHENEDLAKASLIACSPIKAHEVLATVNDYHRDFNQEDPQHILHLLTIYIEGGKPETFWCLRFIVSKIGRLISSFQGKEREHFRITAVVETTLREYPSSVQVVIGGILRTIKLDIFTPHLRCTFCFSYRHLPSKCPSHGRHYTRRIQEQRPAPRRDSVPRDPLPRDPGPRDPRPSPSGRNSGNSDRRARSRSRDSHRSGSRDRARSSSQARSRKSQERSPSREGEVVGETVPIATQVPLAINGLEVVIPLKFSTGETIVTKRAAVFETLKENRLVKRRQAAQERDSQVESDRRSSEIHSEGLSPKASRDSTPNRGSPIAAAFQEGTESRPTGRRPITRAQSVRPGQVVDSPESASQSYQHQKKGCRTLVFEQHEANGHVIGSILQCAGVGIAQKEGEPSQFPP
jgi:hypothetical protein